MKKSLLIASFLTLTLNSWAADLKPVPGKGAVKKSSTGICHASDSRHYAKLKHFTPYDNLKACLDSGGQQAGVKKS